MALIWLSTALNDLDVISDQIMLDDPAAAEREVATIFEASEHLNRFRYLGRFGRWPESRELVIEGRYILAYREAGEDIEIIAVLRAERQWPETPEER
jgi:plasmid stabilization system protein ParE